MKKWYKSRSCWSAVLKIVGGSVLLGSQFLAGEVNTEALLAGLTTSIWVLLI